MSYTGFFAAEDLYEVAKDGDPAKGSWVVPVARDRRDRRALVRQVTDPDDRRATAASSTAGRLRLPARRPRAAAVGVVLHARGAHPLRRRATRWRSCSTRTATDDGRARSCELTICEPALGSGAFLVEAVRQLAEQYLHAPAEGARRDDRPRASTRASCRR